MRKIVYRLEPRQIGRLRELALGFLTLTLVLDTASLVFGGPWWIVSVFSGIFTIWYAISWLGQRGAYTEIDDWGVRARVFVGTYREAEWTQIEDVVIHRRDRNESVHIQLRAGGGFTLGVPVFSTLLPDLGFQRKFEHIQEAWLSTRL